MRIPRLWHPRKEPDNAASKPDAPPPPPPPKRPLPPGYMDEGTG